MLTATVSALKLSFVARKLTFVVLERLGRSRIRYRALWVTVLPHRGVGAPRECFAVSLIVIIGLPRVAESVVLPHAAKLCIRRPERKAVRRLLEVRHASPVLVPFQKGVRDRG